MHPNQPSPPRPADLGKRIDGPELGRTAEQEGDFSPFASSSATPRPRPRPLALHTRSSPARTEEKREGVPSVLSRRTLLRCNTTDESPQGGRVWVRHQISRNSGCVGALSGFDQAFRRCRCCRSLACCRAAIPTISVLLFFPSSTTPANKRPPPSPPRITPCILRVRVHATATGLLVSVATAPHCTASHHHHTHRHRHTGTGTRRTTAGWAKLCVCPACLYLFGYFPIPLLEREFDGCCPALIIVKPRIGIFLCCSHSAASTSGGFDPGAFSGKEAIRLRSSTTRPRRGSGEERGCGVSLGGGHDTAAISSYFLSLCYGRAEAVRRGMTGPRDSGRVTD